MNMLVDHLPLDARQDRRDIIRRTPSVLQNIQTKLARAIDVWVKHRTDELDSWGFVRVLFFKMHHQAECTILERCFRRADNHSVPTRRPL